MNESFSEFNNSTVNSNSTAKAPEAVSENTPTQGQAAAPESDVGVSQAQTKCDKTDSAGQAHAPAPKSVSDLVAEAMIDCFNRAGSSDTTAELRLKELSLALKCSKLLPELEMADQKIFAQSLKNQQAQRKAQIEDMFPF